MQDSSTGRPTAPTTALVVDASHAERVAFGWDLIRAEGERLARFAAEMTAIGAFAMTACGGTVERSTSPAPGPCDPPAVVSSCYSPGGNVTRCPEADGS